MGSSTNPAPVDHYDSRTYTRKGLSTRVVVREKTYVKSRSQRLVDFLRPSMRIGFNVVQGFEVSKVMFCIVFPVFMLIYWKSIQRKLPDQWESQLAGLQHRQLKEEAVPEHETDYFKIIDTFQERRERALERRRKEVASTS